MHDATAMFVLTLYKDHPSAAKALSTMHGNDIPGMKHWSGQSLLAVRDATPGIVDMSLLDAIRTARPLAMYYCYDKFELRPGLPEVLNHAIAQAIDTKLDYVAWIHPDMDFSVDPLWFTRCVLWLEDEPACGKVSPAEYPTHQDALQAVESYSPIFENACPWVMRVSDLRELWDSAGWVIDPAYELMQFEDWDLNNRIQSELGKTIQVIPWAQVIHEGMGTRRHHDYGDTWETNRKYFRQKWGTMPNNNCAL